MYKIALGVAAAMILAGCNAKMAYALHGNFILDKTVEEISVTENKLGELRTVQLGQPMIMYKKTSKTLYDKTDIRFNALNDAEITTKEGDIYRIIKAYSYTPVSADNENKTFRIDLQADGKEVSALWLEVDEAGKLVRSNLTEVAQETQTLKDGDTLFSPLFTPVPKDISTVKPDTFFKQELLYSGMSSDNIVMEYREYKGSPDSLVVSETLTFNLSASDIIRHKKFKLQVLYTDGQKIKFRVLATPV